MLEFLINIIFYQSLIQINQTQPCFLNYTAGIQMLQNCGMDKDFIKSALLPWVWITGGFISLILIAILILFTYIKYQKVVYPILMGFMYLPLTYFLFPAQFLSFAFVFAGCALGLLIAYVYVSQTNES